MKRILSLLAVWSLALVDAGAASAQVKVVASLPELAALTREVGGSRVRVTSLAKPDQDYHRVEARPSDVRQVADADLLVRAGMDLDMWVDALITSARNSDVAKTGKGYVDTSRMVKKIEIPTQRITGASGDIHVQGNPHYLADPGNGKVAAYQILLGLRKVDPAGAATYDANYNRFAQESDRRIAIWKQRLAPYKGRSVVTFHKDHEYFLQRFGLKAFGYVEPRPGIPPSAGHVNSLANRMKAANVKGVVVPSIYSLRFPNVLKQQAGAKVIQVPYSVGSRGTTDYFSYVSAIVDGYRQALS